MPDDATPPGPRQRGLSSSSWLVRLAPLRASLVGVVLLVLGFTADGYGVLVWVGLLAIVVGAGGAYALNRDRRERG